jgi:hypothetical protein
MSDFTSFQWPAPSDWQAFERMCHALWTHIWEDPNTQMNGRSGQAQYGVDVYGTAKGADRISGVQCKGKDGSYGSKATEKELRREVEKAKRFQPPLETFIFATTSPNDAELQRVARSITEEHRKAGLFAVQVLGWGEICLRLARYQSLLHQFFPQFFQTPDETQISQSVRTRSDSSRPEATELIIARIDRLEIEPS